MLGKPFQPRLIFAGKAGEKVGTFDNHKRGII